MAKSVFSRDDYFKMLNGVLRPSSSPGLLGPQPVLLDKLRASIRKRREFGVELPKLDTSLFSKS